LNPFNTKLSIDVTIPKASPTIRSSTTKGTAGHSTEAYPVYARPYRERFTRKVTVNIKWMEEMEGKGAGDLSHQWSDGADGGGREQRVHDDEDHRGDGRDHRAEPIQVDEEALQKHMPQHKSFNHSFNQ